MIRQFRCVAIPSILLCLGILANAEIRVGNDDAMKAAIKKTAPDYPPIAKQLRIVGHVHAERGVESTSSFSTFYTCPQSVTDPFR